MRDADVRAAVLSKLTADYRGDPDTRIVEEMGVWSGSVRIDIAVINGELFGYELKSDSDTLERLPFQADLYSRVFDRVVLVAGARHAGQVATYVPEWWGITVATSAPRGVYLTEKRSAGFNPAPDPYLIAQLLWKEEALALLQQRGLERGWRGKRVKEIHRRLAEILPIDVLSASVRTVLKRREGWLGQERPRDLDMAVHADLNPMF